MPAGGHRPRVAAPRRPPRLCSGQHQPGSPQPPGGHRHDTLQQGMGCHSMPTRLADNAGSYMSEQEQIVSRRGSCLGLHLHREGLLVLHALQTYGRQLQLMLRPDSWAGMDADAAQPPRVLPQRPLRVPGHSPASWGLCCRTARYASCGAWQVRTGVGPDAQCVV